MDKTSRYFETETTDPRDNENNDDNIKNTHSLRNKKYFFVFVVENLFPIFLQLFNKAFY